MEKKTIKLNVYNLAGEKVSTVSANKEVFGHEIHNQAMFDAVNVYLANRRQATAKTKKRSEVSGGGKKPWRQKGTGRARAGSTRSPIWVGGGNVFGPKGNQNFKLSQNKKQHSLALKSAYSSLGKDNIYILESLEVKGQTKEISSLLKALKLENKKVILVSDDSLILRASANIANVTNRAIGNISVYDLLNTNALILTSKEEVTKIEASVLKDTKEEK